MWIFPSIQFRVERWKFNKEYGVYVSTLGNFKDRHKRNLPVKIDQKGYCAVLTENNIYVRAHRLVLKTWRPAPDMENLTVDHLLITIKEIILWLTLSGLSEMKTRRELRQIN